MLDRRLPISDERVATPIDFGTQSIGAITPDSSEEITLHIAKRINSLRGNSENSFGEVMYAISRQ